MTDDDMNIVDKIHAMHAYDLGAVDSGTKDETLRSQIKSMLNKDKDLDWVEKILAKCVHDLSEPPYTISDVKKFMNWIEETMGVDWL